MYHIPKIKLSVVRDGTALTSDRRKVSQSSDAARLLRPYFDGLDREHFVVLLVDAKHHAIGLSTVSIGSLTVSIVHPREVFKVAVVGNASAVIFAHNHPSGDTTPSQEDRVLTSRLIAGGELLGIPVLDHVVLGDGENFYSFADSGTLK